MADAVDRFRRGLSFRVQEYAVLTTGTHLTLRVDRGFTSRWSDTAPDIDPWLLLTAAHLETNIRATLLPDDDTGEAHPWTALAELLTAAGVPTTPEQLQVVPYDIDLSPRLRARLHPSTPVADRPDRKP